MVEFPNLFYPLGDATAGQMVGSPEDGNEQKYLGEIPGEVILHVLNAITVDVNLVIAQVCVTF